MEIRAFIYFLFIFKRVDIVTISIPQRNLLTRQGVYIYSLGVGGESSAE